MADDSRRFRAPCGELVGSCLPLRTGEKRPCATVLTLSASAWGDPHAGKASAGRPGFSYAGGETAPMPPELAPGRFSSFADPGAQRSARPNHLAQHGRGAECGRMTHPSPYCGERGGQRPSSAPTSVPQPAFAEGFGGRAGKRAERFLASRSVPVILQASSHHRRAASA